MRWTSSVCLAALFVASLPMLETNASTCPSRKQISGTWKGNDGGKYVIRRANNNVIWWMGESADDGKTWTNVFKGVYDGKKTITGEWIDVRGWKDASSGQGTLTLELIGTATALNGFKKVAGTGAPFSGSMWSFSCN